MKRRARRKITILLLEVLILIILIGYIIIRYKYENVFCNNTIINGVDCSLMTIEEAEEAIQQKEDEYVLEIIFKDNDVENISGTEIKLTIKNLEQELNNIKERQRKSIFLTGGTYNLDNFSYDADKLKKLLSCTKQLQKDYMKEKTKVKYCFNTSSKRFEIQKQDVYYLNFKQVFNKVSKAIEEGQNSVSLQSLYDISEEDSTLKELNSYVSATITYQLPQGEVYELSANTLYTWIAQDEEGNYFKDEEMWNKNLEEFVAEKLSTLVDTTGIKRKFKPTGKDSTISVEGGNYGYRIDTTAEIEKLKEELSNQEKVTREPCYASRELFPESKELGNSYVEIDLTRQKVWVYVKGKLEVETDCVTGCVNKGHETPTGVYTLTYKQKDRILRGEKLPNGRYSYQSHVDYWMPFNGGIGLHDASWRSTFGGKIYISNGSHGCVNLPLESAEKIYGIINKKMPIVVYKSE